MIPEKLKEIDEIVGKQQYLKGLCSLATQL